MAFSTSLDLSLRRFSLAWTVHFWTSVVWDQPRLVGPHRWDVQEGLCAACAAENHGRSPWLCWHSALLIYAEDFTRSTQGRSCEAAAAWKSSFSSWPCCCSLFRNGIKSESFLDPNPAWAWSLCSAPSLSPFYRWASGGAEPRPTACARAGLSSSPESECKLTVVFETISFSVLKAYLCEGAIITSVWCNSLKIKNPLLERFPVLSNRLTHRPSGCF